MSGKTKPGRPVPGSEAEQLREATRAAHEAARDLRQALAEARQLREESRRLQRDHVAALGETLAKATAAGEEKIFNAVNQALEHGQSEINAVLDFLDKILGVADAGGLGKVIVDDAAAKIAAQLSAELELPPGAAVQLKRRRDAGRVFVTTDPALAPPGSVVIDGR